MIDIAGLHKADVLAALYNAASPVGMGFLRTDGAPPIMDRAEAQHVLSERGGDSQQTAREMGIPIVQRHQLRFDYVHGRPIKCDLSSDIVDVSVYDELHGSGAAAHAIGELRRTGNPSTDGIYKAHVERLRRRAEEVLEDPDTFTALERDAGMGDFTERLTMLARRELGGDTVH